MNGQCQKCGDEDDDRHICDPTAVKRHQAITKPMVSPQTSQPVSHDDFIRDFVYTAVKNHIDRFTPAEMNIEYASVEMKKFGGVRDRDRILINIDGVPYVVECRIWSSA